ncbi:MAG: CAP domain-containing protein [Proteobacteria bacterium]|nr:CAP domain-containing protein [Pseudomonadota bacterium]MBU4355257.1 CAP domain-containing protein [Pseudomonadota bacterium]MBU4447363.1 CAP domain-containing protein [Pseudomonadota bacterium]MCG2771536.1 CAP domain-containing protein [Desulfobacterales bacterium]
MKSNLKWTTALVVLLAAWLFVPSAWGQLRVKSGALSRSSGILHPKELERRIFQLTNEARHKNGLPTLDWDSGLAVKAREKSDDMIKNNYFSHISPDGKTLKDRFQEEKPASIRNISRIGENIYMGDRLDYSTDIKTQARLIVDGWMTSPGHRRNILDPKYTHLGVGVAAKDKMCYATQIFVGMKSR